jgi:spore coat polysaccharide biosynthesis protein SpsF
MSYKTEQENFWAGDFGTDYIQRNKSDADKSAKIAAFTQIFRCTSGISSVIELGSNIGLNLQAIKQLLPNTKMAAIEINKSAVEHLKNIPELKIYNSSILDVNIEEKHDLSFIKGVLIHIDPNSLVKAYETLYKSSKKYICIAEYYNPTPVEINYRGHKDRLFKRDFAGEMLEKYPDLKLIDYGFLYSKDNNFQYDDITWFLLEKTS